MFNLNQKQYDLLVEFFNSNKSSNSLLSIKLVRTLLAQTLKSSRKNQINANASDFNRLATLLDHDKDGYQSFEEFVLFLNLAMAKKATLESRIENYFNSISVSEFLKPEEATKCVDFLNEFYLPDQESLNQIHYSFGDSTNKLLKLYNTIVFGQKVERSTKLSTCLTEPIAKKLLAKELAIYLKSSLYVL